MIELAYQNLEHYRKYLGIERLMIGVSGGRSSAYQAAHLAAAARKYLGYIPAGWIFSFQNTSLERSETYDFLHLLDLHLFDEKLVLLEWLPGGKYEVVTHNTMKRHGEVFDAMLNTPLKRRDGTVGVRPLPNPTQRVCTANLKIKTAHRYARQTLGWPKEYFSAIGYRADEKRRCDKAWLKDERRGFDEGGIGVFPMFDAGVIADTVDRFWYASPIDLKIDSIFGNCDFCFLASTWKIKERMLLVALETQTKLRPGAEAPERIARWIAWEERKSDRPGTFRKDRPTMRVLWDQVCAGDFQAVGNGALGIDCLACTD